eukprot:753857-Hanusia_phi.AAC.3
MARKLPQRTCQGPSFPDMTSLEGEASPRRYDAAPLPLEAILTEAPSRPQPESDSSPEPAPVSNTINITSGRARARAEARAAAQAKNGRDITAMTQKERESLLHEVVHAVQALVLHEICKDISDASSSNVCTLLLTVFSINLLSNERLILQSISCLEDLKQLSAACEKRTMTLRHRPMGMTEKGRIQSRKRFASQQGKDQSESVQEVVAACFNLKCEILKAVLRFGLVATTPEEDWNEDDAWFEYSEGENQCPQQAAEEKSENVSQSTGQDDKSQGVSNPVEEKSGAAALIEGDALLSRKRKTCKSSSAPFRIHLKEAVAPDAENKIKRPLTAPSTAGVSAEQSSGPEVKRARALEPLSPEDVTSGTAYYNPGSRPLGANFQSSRIGAPPVSRLEAVIQVAVALPLLPPLTQPSGPASAPETDAL